MLAFGCPRVVATRGDALDSPGDRASIQRSEDEPNPDQTIFIVPDPEQGQRLSLGQPLPSSEPTNHSIPGRYHRPKLRFRGET
jgi:hypothetical protein